MNERPVIVVGAAGHGQVVADALQASGRMVPGFVDRSVARRATVAGLPVRGDDDWVKAVTLEDRVVVGAGAVVLEPGTGQGALVGVPARRRERT